MEGLIRDPLHDHDLQTFDSLSGDTQTIIFSELGYNDLKACRLICKSWNETISSAKLLFKHAVLVYREEKLTFWQSLKRAFELFQAKLLFTVPTFRFQGSIGSSAYIWFDKGHTRNIKSIEFLDCNLHIQQLLLLFRQTGSVTSLTISGPNSSIKFPDPFRPNSAEFMRPYYMKASLANFRNLEKCHINLPVAGQFSVFLNLLILTCDKMKDFRITFASGFPWVNLALFENLGTYLKKVRGNLQVFHMKVLPFVPPPAVHVFIPPIVGEPQGGHGNLDQFLQTIHAERWYDFHLDLLEELKLEFPTTKSTLPRIQHVLSQFLMSLRKLNFFSLSALQIVAGTELEILELAPRTFKTLQISGIQGPRVANNVIVGLVPEFTQMHSNLEVKFENRLMKMSRVVWDADFINTIVVQQLAVLTKLDINQLPDSPALQINDALLQSIIANAENLVELNLNHCDLENVTDFGVSGINAEAAQRMITNGDFKIQYGDQTGFPVSRLTNLQVLRMTNSLSNFVTDVSARLAFGGNPKLRMLTLAHPKFTEGGLDTLKEHFKWNQVVKIDVRVSP